MHNAKTAVMHLSNEEIEWSGQWQWRLLWTTHKSNLHFCCCMELLVSSVLHVQTPEGLGTRLYFNVLPNKGLLGTTLCMTVHVQPNTHYSLHSPASPGLLDGWVPGSLDASGSSEQCCKTTNCIYTVLFLAAARTTKVNKTLPETFWHMDDVPVQTKHLLTDFQALCPLVIDKHYRLLSS